MIEERINKFKSRPLSWSSISSFRYDKEKWYKNYILNEKEPDTEELIFGKKVADSLQTETPLVPFTLYPVVEQKLEVVFGGIPLIGFMDTYDPTTHSFREFKTGKKAWDQKRADEHGQITMYSLMLFITHKVRPETYNMHLEWVPTQQNGDFSISFVEPVKIHIFETKRTMNDLVSFGAYIRVTYDEMIDFIEEKGVANVSTRANRYCKRPCKQDY